MSAAWWVAAAGCLWAVSRAAARQKKPVAALFANAVLGTGILALSSFLAEYTLIELPLNWFTAFVCVVLGAPGALLLLAANFWIL